MYYIQYNQLNLHDRLPLPSSMPVKISRNTIYPKGYCGQPFPLISCSLVLPFSLCIKVPQLGYTSL